MSCNCNTKETCTQTTCSCAIKDFPTDCIKYTGETLECSGIEEGTLLTELITQLDAFICEKYDFAINFFQLVNVGEGAEIYKGDNLVGQKEIRSITKTGDLIAITENTNEIDITIDEDELIDFIGENSTNSTYAVNNLSDGAEIYKDSTVVVDETTFNIRTLKSTDASVTITQNSEDIDLSVATSDGSDTKIEDGDYTTVVGSGTIGDPYQINIEQSDFLENNPAEGSFIANKNPNKTETLGVAGTYSVVAADNNYVIEIDNGANDVTIDVSGALGTDNFFVGFVQKGTGEVQFSGYDTKPEFFTDIMLGQGHIAALEIINSTKYIFGTFKTA